MASLGSSQLPSSRVKEILLVVGVLAAGGAIAAAWLWYDKHEIETADGKIETTIRLDNGMSLAVESVDIDTTTTDPNTNQRTTETTTHWRLREFDAQSGKLHARKVTEVHPECVAARGGRIWCRWDGKLRLLDDQLATVADEEQLRTGPLADGMQSDKLVADRNGVLQVMSMDGRPALIDPLTRRVTGTDALPADVRQSRGHLMPIARVGGAMYELLTVPGGQRVTLSRTKRGATSKLLAPKTTWLADGFVSNGGSGDSDVLNVPAGLFLVHRDSVAADAQLRISHVSYDGKVLWTAKLPSPIDSGVVEPDGVVLTGPDLSLKLSLAKGAVVWSRHN